MRALLQRVTSATVSVGGETVGAIGPGLLVLAGVRRGDTVEDSEWIAGKIASLRIFPDDAGRMNLSVAEVGGSVLLVSQFTLYGDPRRGRRPSFEKAARPEEAVPLLDVLHRFLEAAGVPVSTGRFGAHMAVELVNDGPVTLMIDSGDRRRGRGGAAAARGAPGTDRLRLVGAGSSLRGVPLLLASASPRRRALLRDLGLSFTVEAPGIDESANLPDDPEEIARRVAERKARAGAATRKEGLVLSADTIVVLEGRVFGKPASEEEAVSMLTALSGREHDVLTGVCVGNAATNRFHSTVVRTGVRLRSLVEGEIRRYVETGEGLDKAGAYAIQGRGALLVAGIYGDYTNVVGLPLGVTLDLLDRALDEDRPARGRSG